MAGNHSLVHTAFDMLALALAMAAGWAVIRWRLVGPIEKTAAALGASYFICLMAGSILGAFFFGTLNLYVSGIAGVGRSIVGSLFGAVLAVEIYKAWRGLRPSTGYVYIVPLCVSIIIGRLGCYFSGLEDNTYGTPTTLPWAHDFGDGIGRHPVQLYESFSMLVFLVCALALVARRTDIIVRYGFYMCIGFYAAQRFVWEFLKPYAAVAGPLDIFQFLCMALMGYSIFMIIRTVNDNRAT